MQHIFQIHSFAFLWHSLNCNSQNHVIIFNHEKKICKAFAFLLLMLTIRHWNVLLKVPLHHHSALWDITVSQGPEVKGAGWCSGLWRDAWWDPPLCLGGSGSWRHWGEPNWCWKTLGGPDWHRKGPAGVGAGTGPIAAWRPGLWSSPRRPIPGADVPHWSWPGPTGNVSIPADMKSWERNKSKRFWLHFISIFENVVY